MDAMLAADVAYATTDPVASVAVVFGSVNTRGHLFHADETGSDSFGNAQIRGTTLVVAKSALPGLATDSQLTADGVRYRVREISDMADGLEQHIALAEDPA